MQSDWRNVIELRAKRTVGDGLGRVEVMPYDDAYEPSQELVRVTAQMREAQAAVEGVMIGWREVLPGDVLGVLHRAVSLLSEPDRNVWPRAVGGTLNRL